MTDREQKMLMRGAAAGVLVGVALGLLIALFIATQAPAAAWLPSVLLPLALVAGWWGVHEVKARGRRTPGGG